MVEPLLGTNSKYTAARQNCIFLHINPISPNKLKKQFNGYLIIIRCCAIDPATTLEGEKKTQKGTNLA
jgi:hypothetical protein